MNGGVPIYLIHGFLDAGKTSFLQYTMDQDYFATGEKTLLILCEEGEEEFEPSFLAEHNTVLEICESEADMTTDFLKTLKRKYRPERVVIEYNGMWMMNTIMDLKLPFGWEMYQVINIANAETFGVYLNNMKSLIGEQVKASEMVLFNRGSEDMPLANYRRAIKAVSRAVQVVFEDEEGEMIDVPEILPYDLNSSEITVEDDDFGIWYIDAMDHPENYEGKTIRFKGYAMTSRELPKGYFVPGRKAMTCCANDIRFLGYVCKLPDKAKVRNKDWVEVTAEFKSGYMDVYEGEGPILTAKEMKLAEAPEDELVYFS